nr:hypothetical protein Iba_chr09eCG4670 [Ipomoea batatas]
MGRLEGWPNDIHCAGASQISIGAREDRISKFEVGFKAQQERTAIDAGREREEKGLKLERRTRSPGGDQSPLTSNLKAQRTGANVVALLRFSCLSGDLIGPWHERNWHHTQNNTELEFVMNSMRVLQLCEYFLYISDNHSVLICSGRLSLQLEKNVIGMAMKCFFRSKRHATQLEEAHEMPTADDSQLDFNQIALPYLMASSFRAEQTSR